MINCAGSTKVLIASLIFSSTAPVPLFPEFTSTPDVWDSKDCAVHLHKAENDRIEEWIDRRRESAITCIEWKECYRLASRSLWEGATILNRKRRPIKFCRFVTNNKHRDLGPIFTLIPDLHGLKIFRFQSVDLCGPEDAETLCFWACEVVAGNSAR